MIGVYGGNLIIPVRPAALSVTLLAAFDVLDSDIKSAETELTYPGGKLGGPIDLQSIPSGLKYVQVQMEVGFVVEETSEIAFRFRCGLDDWSSPIIWQIVFAPNVAELDPASAERLHNTIQMLS